MEKTEGMFHTDKSRVEKIKKTILCFGDSNTHGYRSKDCGRFGEEERWTCLLGKALGDGYRVIEEGLNGRTTVFDDPMEEGLNGLPYLYPCLKTHKPLDLLIIMLGTNDTKERFHVEAEEIGRGMECLIRKAFEAEEVWRKQPQILIMAPPPIGKAYDTTYVAEEMGRGCVEKSEKLAEVYAKLAKTWNCRFLDTGSVSGISMWPYDYMHLSPESHRILAETLAEQIRAWL